MTGRIYNGLKSELACAKFLIFKLMSVRIWLSDSITLAKEIFHELVRGIHISPYNFLYCFTNGVHNFLS
jgi:hypothetical protein